MLTGQINHYGGNVVDPTARELLSETQSQVQDLQDNAVVLNGFFDDTLGWWQQAKGEEKREDSVIVHGREITQNTGNREVSPFMVTQTKVNYSSDTGELFTRITDTYHELIGEGEITADRDSSTPNFTATGATAYNKFKGNVGVCASTYRVYDVGYTDEELGGRGASKSCAGGFMAYRHGAYRQGKNGGSYTIGLETYTFNVPTYPDSSDFYGNSDNIDHFSFNTWSCGYHCGVGGTHPVTTGILINGFSTDTYPTYTSGAYSGITIGKSAMKINGTNSPYTVGVNMGSWSKSSYYGHKAIRVGYAPRTLSVRGSALMEAPSFKFLNPNGDMPVVISAGNIIENGEIVRGYTPYLLFKTGADSSERPADVSRAKIGYNTANQYLNTVSDGDIRFVVNGTFSSTANPSQDSDQDPTIPINTETDAIIYKFQGSSFISSVTASTEETPLYANLGSASYKWGNIYANNGTINTSDRNAKRDILDIDERILRAWAKVNYKAFKFKSGDRIHVGVIAQEIDEAFKSEGLNARDYGLFCEDTDEDGNKILGVRYSECLALECAYLRNRLGA